MSKINYFVSGGAGFIGSHLIDRLVKTGNVTIYDNLSSGKKEFISHHEGEKGFHFIQEDLLDLETLKNAIRGSDIVFHLAANPDARLGIEDTSLDLKLETIATYNVLEAMRVNGVRKIVFSSSGTVYGETPVIPLPENYGPLFPISMYGAGKLAGEGLISGFCHTFDMQGWIFRFANVIGERTTHGVIFDFINKLRRIPEELEILGDGTQCKPYIYVKDCVGGILYGLTHSSDRINVFNLGCPSATDVTTIAKVVIEEMGLNDVTLRYTGGDRGWPGDVPQTRFDVSKINNIGWQTEYTSDEAVRKAVRKILGKE